jgi:hypothetical protein
MMRAVHVRPRWHSEWSLVGKAAFTPMISSPSLTEHLILDICCEINAIGNLKSAVESSLEQERPLSATFVLRLLGATQQFVAFRAIFDRPANCLRHRRFVICPTHRSFWRHSLEPFGELEMHQRRPDVHDPFLIKRISWSWFSAEFVRIWPTELEFRAKADAAYLALHDYVRSDGETTINGGSRSTRTDARGKLTFVPIGSSVEGWNRFEGRVSSVVAVHLAPTISNFDDVDDISKVAPSLYFDKQQSQSDAPKTPKCPGWLGNRRPRICGDARAVAFVGATACRGRQAFATETGSRRSNCTSVKAR